MLFAGTTWENDFGMRPTGNAEKTVSRGDFNGFGLQEG